MRCPGRRGRRNRRGRYRASGAGLQGCSAGASARDVGGAAVVLEWPAGRGGAGWVCEPPPRSRQIVLEGGAPGGHGRADDEVSCDRGGHRPLEMPSAIGRDAAVATAARGRSRTSRSTSRNARRLLAAVDPIRLAGPREPCRIHPLYAIGVGDNGQAPAHRRRRPGAAGQVPHPHAAASRPDQPPQNFTVHRYPPLNWFGRDVLALLRR